MLVTDAELSLTFQIVYFVFNYVVVLAYARVFLYVFEAKLEKRFRSKAIRLGHFAVYGTLLAVLLLNAILPAEGLSWTLLAAEALVLIVYLLVCLRGSVLHKVFWLFILIVFYVVSHVAAGLIFQALLYSPERPFSLDVENTLISTIAWVFFFLICVLLAKQKRHHVEMSPFAILLLSIIPISSCYLLWLWSNQGFLVYDHAMRLTLSDSTIFLELTAVLLVALMNLIVFVLYDYMLTKAEQTFEQESLVQQAETNKVHYEELKSLYKETRIWRHDYGNHLQAIEAYVSAGNNKDLTSYIKELKGSLDKINYRTRSGSELLDAILSAKISHAEAQGIVFDVDIKTDVSDLPLSDVDGTSLIGNLVDNAIEGCERIDQEGAEKRITLRIGRTKKQLTISLKNTTKGIVRSTGGMFSSSKLTGDHGIGTRQVNAIIKQYGGHIEHEISEGIFEVFITLPVKEKVSSTG